MRLATKPESPDRELTNDALAVMQERVRLKLPVAQSQDTADLFSDHDNYLHFRTLYKQLGGYLALCKVCDDDPESEVTFTQLADILGADRKKPRLYIHRLPLPCTNPKTKTARFVWKWAEVKEKVRHLVIIHLMVQSGKRF